jgi:fermentation-respiration switch protein FrsA (DUF1100 family)
MWVLDWVIGHLDVPADDVVAGGFSMGGDIAVALAGIDHRVSRVAALGSTPDWARPGMRNLDGSGALIDQGTPSPYGRWLYDQLDPVTHLERYAHGPAILFEHGGDDDHVPVENAHRFAAALAGQNPAAGKNVTVRVSDGLAHVDSVRTRTPSTGVSGGSPKAERRAGQRPPGSGAPGGPSVFSNQWWAYGSSLNAGTSR